MEDSVHLSSRREAKVLGIGRDNLRDFKRAFLSRGQFLGGEVNLQIMRVEPNLYSYFPGGELHSNPFFDCLSSLSMSGGGLFVSSIKEFETFVKSGKECLSDRGVSLGFKIHQEHEWHLIGNGMGGRVVQKLSHW